MTNADQGSHGNGVVASELVHLEVADAVATITLDSPHNRNALSSTLRRQLAARLEQAVRDDAVRVIVLTHTGTVFCAGADLAEAREPAGSHQGVADLPRLLTAVRNSPKPVVARLAGTARAGGVGLVASCDLAVASDEVTFAFPEVRLGLVPAVISVPLRRRVHAQALRALFLTGEVFDATHAVRIGLLDAAVPADRLDDEVGRYSAMLLRGEPRALAATKAVLADSPDDDAEELDVLARLSAAYFNSREGQEGMSAFAERREPAWVVGEGGRHEETWRREGDVRREGDRRPEGDVRREGDTRRKGETPNEKDTPTEGDAPHEGNTRRNRDDTHHPETNA